MCAAEIPPAHITCSGCQREIDGVDSFCRFCGAPTRDRVKPSETPVSAADVAQPSAPDLTPPTPTHSATSSSSASLTPDVPQPHAEDVSDLSALLPIDATASTQGMRPTTKNGSVTAPMSQPAPGTLAALPSLNVDVVPPASVPGARLDGTQADEGEDPFASLLPPEPSLPLAAQALGAAAGDDHADDEPVSEDCGPGGHNADSRRATTLPTGALRPPLASLNGSASGGAPQTAHVPEDASPAPVTPVIGSCPNCRADVSPTARFCRRCGGAVRQDPTATTPAATLVGTVDEDATPAPLTPRLPELAGQRADDDRRTAAATPVVHNETKVGSAAEEQPTIVASLRSAIDTTPRRCTSCEYEVSATATFCRACGARLDAEAPAADECAICAAPTASGSTLCEHCNALESA